MAGGEEEEMGELVEGTSRRRQTSRDAVMVLAANLAELQRTGGTRAQPAEQRNILEECFPGPTWLSYLARVVH
jgi:hypothetical protein